MCGRSRCALAPEQVEQTAGVPRERWVDRERYRPSHNVSPGAWTPILHLNEQHMPQLQTMRWGLVPSFTKPGEKPDFFRMFNARSESVAEKPVFSRLLKRQRCVVILDGFYEWKTDAGGKKQPYYCNFGEGNVMKMAGLYDVWAGGPEGPLATYTILTTDAAPRLTWLHNRMPVILPDDKAVQAWLDMGSKPTVNKDSLQQEQQQQQQEEGDSVTKEHETDKADVEGSIHASFSHNLLEQLCQPFNGDTLVWHPVTPEMSKPSYDSPDASKDVRTKKGSISNFFKPSKQPAAAAGTAKAGGKGITASKTAAAAAAAGVEASPKKGTVAGQEAAVATAHDSADHKQQQRAGKGGIDSFFKPVASPAKSKQKQSMEGDEGVAAARNPDEQTGPSAEDDAVAKKLADHEAGSKRHTKELEQRTPTKRARGRAS